MGCCEHGDEPSGSIEGWEVLQQLSNFHFLKKDSKVELGGWLFVCLVGWLVSQSVSRWKRKNILLLNIFRLRRKIRNSKILKKLDNIKNLISDILAYLSYCDVIFFCLSSPSTTFNMI
jgi:hypothetical protein